MARVVGILEAGMRQILVASTAYAKEGIGAGAVVEYAGTLRKK